MEGHSSRHLVGLSNPMPPLLPQAANLETVEVAVTLDLGIPNVLELMSTACLFPESMLLFFTRFSCICQCLHQPFLTCFLNTSLRVSVFSTSSTWQQGLGMGTGLGWEQTPACSAQRKRKQRTWRAPGGLFLAAPVACMSCLVSMVRWGHGVGTAVHRECGHVRRLQGQPAISWPQPLCCG